MLGQTQEGGAATRRPLCSLRRPEMRELALVRHTNVTDAADHRGLTIIETDLPGKTYMLMHACGGQVIGQYSQTAPLQAMAPPSTYAQGGGRTAITIGEALEATAMTAGQKPVDWSDAAAVQAAEVRAAGSSTRTPGGVAAAAQSAATLNARATRDEDKTRLDDVLTDATAKLPSDKPATR
ncbi:hypothetical protein L1049_020965 [Liquidambar formosana]|uniref:SMP domain-containing protein n=1 Tax=Liquidambar formosana TaxID=63359 RepID=A0AAP0S8M3_LIQFO